jgi:hypothetical protein
MIDRKSKRWKRREKNETTEMKKSEGENERTFKRQMLERERGREGERGREREKYI